MPENASVPLNRIERVLASMIAGVVGLSLLAIVGTLIGSVSGADMSTGVWPALLGIGYFGLPLAFLLIITFIVLSVTRRRRIARDGDR